MQETNNKLEYSSQNSPPLLGFDCKTVQEGSKLVKSCRKSLADLRSNLKLFCSTPLGRATYKKVMEFSFSRNFEDIEKGIKAHLTLDGDSGYVSHFQESNSGSCIGESSESNSVTKMVEDNIYISEDALLERPEVYSVNSDKAKNEEENFEEYSHLFYLNDSVVGSSRSASERTCLSGLENDSDISSVIYPIDNIVIAEDDLKFEYNSTNKMKNEVVDNLGVNKSNLNSPIIKKYKKSHSSPLKKTSSPLKIKQSCSSVGQNKENDMNYLNLSKSSSKDKESNNIVEKSSLTVKKSLFPTENFKTFVSKVPEESDYINLNISANTSHTKSFDSSRLSPELFSDDETTTNTTTTTNVIQNFKEVEKKITEENCVNKDDEILLKRTRDTLKGVLPPPSVTIIQISPEEILHKIYKNSDLFFSKTEIENIRSIKDVNAADNSECNTSSNCNTNDPTKNKSETQRKSLLVTCDFQSIDSVEWPEIAKYRFHGLLYNRTKFSEEFEHLCQKYGERYVGVETQSTCTVFSNEISSPSKRRLIRARKVGKSPGKRLSHLARRRITFSKDSLHSSNSFIGARSRQILIDARKQAVLSKSPRKTPRKSPRKTPRKSPRKRKTPNSSTKKKRLSELFSKANSEASTSYCSPSKILPLRSPYDNFNGNSESSSVLSTDSSSSTSKRRTPRRALFTSPKKMSPQKSFSSLYSKKKLTPKRALFMSPEKDSNCDKKRKRSENEGDESELLIKTKLPRSLSFPAQSSSSSTENPRIISKFKSSGNLSSSSVQSHSQDLTEHRKKKLLWAVSEALRSQSISMAHPQFKVFASVLARVTRRLLPNLNTSATRPEGSTSELMLRIARQHVFAVTRGKTVDEILHDVEKNKVKQSKPVGYVWPTECQSGNNKENCSRSKPSTSTSGVLMQNNQLRKSFRDEKVERIRRAINFGECENDVENRSSNI